jgi:site-specific DNA-methyltransferase (adenine-specific)
MSLPKTYYQEDGITLYCGDCREILPTLGKVDLVLTDPPYGIGMASWDRNPPSKDVIDLVRNSGDRQIIFGGNFFDLPRTEGWLCWDKTFSDDSRGKKLTKGGVPRENMQDFELAWTSFLSKPKFIRYTYIGNLTGFDDNLKIDYKQGAKQHPTQKPIALIERCIELAGEPQSIADPFFGSGTTAVACKRLGRKFIGIEISEKYCEIAVDRLRQMELFK